MKKTLEQKHFSRFKPALTEYPHFIESQINSFAVFVEQHLVNLFKEFSPISDYSGKKFELTIDSIELGKPKFDEHYAKSRQISYEAPLRAKVTLFNKSLGSKKEQEIFLSDFPLMTDHGTFIINGIERVIVPQLVRSSGVLFTEGESRGKRVFGAKIIPSRGAWIEIEADYQGALQVRVDRKRKFPITSLLYVMGIETPEAILELFAKDEVASKYIRTTLEKDKNTGPKDAYVDIYRRLREGDVVTYNNAKEYVTSLFDAEHYDLSNVGRFRFNQRFGGKTDKDTLEKNRLITIDDMKTIISHITKLNDDPQSQPDDIDHLGSRRVRFVGEQLEQKLRIGLSRMKRNVQDRMSTTDLDTTLPIKLLNPRPLAASVKEFYATNQLSQFMLQDNILGEIEHMRTLSALGPGGLTRERAGYEVRDVHPSHYGRLCPIHTPEGPNIGLVLRLASYARINEFGMIETPYATVKDGKITKEVRYYDAYEEEPFYIAHAGIPTNSKGEITADTVEVRHKGVPMVVSKDMVTHIDVSTNQPFSIATSMIPFVNHDDANRALMGSNMQKQGMPCVIPEMPLVATGIEGPAAKDTGRLILSHTEGEVTYVDAHKVEVTNKDGKVEKYTLRNYIQTNGNTIFHQRPSVNKGQHVKRGDVLADTSSSDRGQIAIGQNLRVAFMSWNGANYEDAIIISEKLVKEKKFASIHIEEVVVNVRDTKLGPEVTTHDIPNISEGKLKNLDEDGIVRIGAEVRPGDLLVGKITPKGETQLTPEERLLRSIFGDKARDVRDSSKRMEPGRQGRVVGVTIFSRENGDTLESGIIKRIHIQIAQMRSVQVGDKLAGRHGNKGVISTVLPEEDMPYDKDGNPVDIILTPLGVPSRMNLGQILELHLGQAAHDLGYQAVVPPFAGATLEEIHDELKKAGLSENGKIPLFDGRTGEQFKQDIAVGYMYIIKLHHMVDDKIHQRSIGPYSLITQQPLGGKSQNGGQRLGEMEMWALLGYGAAYTLREMLTIKSDDILGRSASFDAIVKGEPITQTNLPASFNVLLNNLRALALDVELVKMSDDTRKEAEEAFKQTE